MSERARLLFVVDPRPYRPPSDKAEAELALTNLQIKALEDAIRSARLAGGAATSRARIRQAVSGADRAAASRHFVTANDVFNARSRVNADQAARRKRA